MTLDTQAPQSASYEASTGSFSGTKPMLVYWAAKAVQKLGWTLDSVDDETGAVTYTTGISLGSFSGVSCSLLIEERSPYSFHVSATGKQKMSPLQIVALDVNGEAQKKANKVIEEMKRLAL